MNPMQATMNRNATFATRCRAVSNAQRYADNAAALGRWCAYLAAGWTAAVVGATMAGAL